jgi:hypothetical protein
VPSKSQVKQTYLMELSEVRFDKSEFESIRKGRPIPIAAIELFRPWSALRQHLLSAKHQLQILFPGEQ